MLLKCTSHVLLCCWVIKILEEVGNTAFYILQVREMRLWGHVSGFRSHSKWQSQALSPGPGDTGPRLQPLLNCLNDICSFSGLHEEQNKSQCFSGALSPVFLPTWKMCDVKIPLQGLYTSLVLWDALTQPAPHLYHPLRPGSCLQIWSLSDLVSTRLIHGRKLILCCFHNICLSKLITVTGNHTSLAWGLAAWVDFPGREPEHTGLRGGVLYSWFYWTLGRCWQPSSMGEDYGKRRQKTHLWTSEGETHFSKGVGDAVELIAAAAGFV